MAAQSTGLAEAQATAAAVVELLDVSELTSREDEALASELLGAVQSLLSRVDAERKALKAPHLAAGREVDARYKAPLAELSRVKSLLKARLAEAIERRAEAKALAQRDAQRAVADGDREAASDALERMADASLAAPVQERWSWEIESVDLSQVPTDYLQVRMDKVREEISRAKAEHRDPSIPGVVLRRTVSVVARGR